MIGQHPVIEWILEYRELEKLRSTYVDALPQQVNPPDRPGAHFPEPNRDRHRTNCFIRS